MFQSENNLSGWEELSSISFDNFSDDAKISTKKSDKLREIEQSAEVFAEITPVYEIGNYIMAEFDKVSELIDKHNKHKKKRENSVVDGFLYDENLSELTRYGFDPKNGNSEIFDKLMAIGDAGNWLPLTKKLGYDRLRNFRELSLITKNDPKTIKYLKKAGYDKLPSSWNDNNFTSDQLSRMNRLAREALLAS